MCTLFALLDFTNSSVCRWPKPGYMVVSISAHDKLQSLIEITGLQAPPQAVALQNLDGTVEHAEEALSISELRKLEHGSLLKCRDGVYHSVIFHPGTTGRHGHIIYLYF